LDGFYAQVERSNDARAELAAGQAATPELEAAAGGWPSWLPSGLVNLGLDLRGGAHVLVEVQVQDVYAERLESMWAPVRDAMRDLRDQVGTIRRIEGDKTELRVRIGQPAGMPAALQAVRNLTQPVVSLTGAGSRDFDVVQDGADQIVLRLSDAEKIATAERTLAHSLEIVRRRVDEAGTREPSLQRQGSNRILVQVPGIGSAEELIALIGQTAKLTFNDVIQVTGNPDESPGAGNEIVPSVDEPDTYYVIERRPVVSGEQLDDSQPTFDQNGLPAGAPFDARLVLRRNGQRSAKRRNYQRQGDAGLAARPPGLPHRRSSARPV
jgi:preprotein translocase subunit SecD